MNQNMVPGLIFRGSRSCDRFVPLARRLKSRIDIDDYTAIVEKPVMNQVTDGELRPDDSRYCSHIRFIPALSPLYANKRAELCLAVLNNRHAMRQQDMLELEVFYEALVRCS